MVEMTDKKTAKSGGYFAARAPLLTSLAPKEVEVVALPAFRFRLGEAIAYASGREGGGDYLGSRRSCEGRG